MHLEKWYCDVADGDRVEIHYLAALRLVGTVISYQGKLLPGHRAVAAFRIGASALPTWDSTCVRWPTQLGQLQYLLEGDAPAQQVLWRSGEEQLAWHPIAPNSAVIGPGIGAAARGYVEVIRMNFGPWKLGLKTLLWGRFCGAKRSLVWIVWIGVHPKRLALLDGQRHDLQFANEQEVLGDGFQLQLQAPTVVADERMDQGALNRIPVPKSLASIDFLRGHETKWHAKATLFCPDGVDHGIAIFEKVTWN